MEPCITKELQDEEVSKIESNNNGDTKLLNNNVNGNAKKGWISAIFILGASFGLNISSGAWYTNLIVFLISVFNIKNIPAAQINNIFSGLICFFPFIAAIFADSAFGNYFVTLVSCIISLLGVIMFTLLVTLKSMRPPPCDVNSTTSTSCIPPTISQYTFLYIALTLASLGLGGTRFILGTMGADQFDKPQHQATFFNWFICSLYVGWIIAYTLLIYIQTSVSWALSFAIALAANLLAALLFVAGSKMYRKIPPQGSPFISIARVFVAAFRNSKNERPVIVGRDGEDYCYLHENEEAKLAYGPPTNSLSFLNKAAMTKHNNDNSKKSWTQCTVEEVEDVKKLIKMMPLWTSSMLLSGAIGVILSFTVLMALVMDRRVGTSSFEIPAGTFTVITLIVTAITSSMLDRFTYPAYKKLTGRNLTFIQCIGVGHVSNILASIGFALVERRRLELVRAQHLTDQPNAVAPLSAMWMAFPLAILGIGEGSFFSPEVAFYYQEFPKSLRSTSTAMVSLHIAAGYYLSSAFIDIVGRTSSWLPNDLNHGRVDYAAWVLAVVATVNFAYFLVCAKFYKYNHRSSPGDNLVVPET